MMDAAEKQRPLSWMLRGRTLLIVKLALTALVIVFVAWSLADNFRNYSWQQAQPNWLTLGVAQAAHVVYLIGYALIWWVLTRLHHVAAPVPMTLAIWATSVLGKYVPGKALLWLIRYGYYKQLKPDLSNSAFVRCLFLEYFGGIAAGLLLGLTLLAVLPQAAVPGWWRWVCAIALVAALAILHPKVFGAAEKHVTARLGRKPRKRAISVCETLMVVALYVVNWLMLGVTVNLALLAFAPEQGWDLYLFITVSYTLAGLVGFLALFAPSGLGVREGVFIFTMGQVIPPEQAALAAIAARLIATVGELIFAGVGMLFSPNVRPFRAAQAARDDLAQPESL